MGPSIRIMPRQNSLHRLQKLLHHHRHIKHRKRTLTQSHIQRTLMRSCMITISRMPNHHRRRRRLQPPQNLQNPQPTLITTSLRPNFLLSLRLLNLIQRQSQINHRNMDRLIRNHSRRLTTRIHPNRSNPHRLQQTRQLIRPILLLPTSIRKQQIQTRPTQTAPTTSSRIRMSVNSRTHEKRTYIK